MLLHLKQAQTSYNIETHWNPTVKDKLGFTKRQKSGKKLIFGFFGFWQYWGLNSGPTP
jgi:hypothetical protein